MKKKLLIKNKNMSGKNLKVEDQLSKSQKRKAWARGVIEKKAEQKKHRHRYEVLYCDCPNCGQQEHFICECGKEKD
jgi:hypothetical protein